MANWKEFYNDFLLSTGITEEVRQKAKEGFDIYEIYPDSLNELNGTIFFMIKEDNSKKLIVIGENDEFLGEVDSYDGKSVKVCPLNHVNAEILRKLFSFTAPTNVLNDKKTIGLGDRLGLASSGHIRLIKEYDVKPILAQQSIRELNLTGRNYKGVLDDATWAVFQEGYKGGYGADGDHLKTPDEVKMALECGFTMITLDCSEHIDNDISSLSEEKINKRYDEIPREKREIFERKYADKNFILKDGSIVTFDKQQLKKTVLIYKDAIEFAISIFKGYIKPFARKVDFEMSVDETLTSTAPQAHFFVASELIQAGVDVATIAPRFCGEFQKGIDYIGDISQFEKEFKIHASIAEFFGYKISVHSGSDKFSVFPIVGKETKGIYHVKTAGTNWLEAIRIIALRAPELYRELHAFALDVLDEAKKYYHIGAKEDRIADINSLKDVELPDLMNKDDSRQVIHITYGLILQAKKEDGSLRFKDRIYKVLHKYEDDYYDALYKHIGKHLKTLGN